MTEDTNCKWYESRRVWSAIIAGLLGIYAIVRTVLSTLGVELPEMNLDATAVVDKIFGVLGVVGSIVASILSFISWLKPKQG